jgi:outer membrane protein assembly factor BamA
LKGAVFVDAGNVWTFNEDGNRPGSRFSTNWYREIAVSSGIGLRMDLDFFILRLDLGLPLTNPALPQGEKWIFQSKDQFYQECFDKFGVNYEVYVPNPFTPNIHFGIGYPF